MLSQVSQSLWYLPLIRRDSRTAPGVVSTGLFCSDFKSISQQYDTRTSSLLMLGRVCLVVAVSARRMCERSAASVVQGRMCFGEDMTHSAPKPLWKCSLLVLPHDSAELAQSWPSELARLDALSTWSLLLLTCGEHPTPDSIRRGCECCLKMISMSQT